MPLDAVDRLGQINRFAVKNWFTGLHAFHHRQFAAVTCDQLAQSDQHILARIGVHFGPTALVKRLPRFGDRKVYISCICSRNLRDLGT